MKKKEKLLTKYEIVRINLGLLQSELGEKLDMGQGTVSKIENMKIKPNYKYLKGLLKLGVDLNELLK